MTQRVEIASLEIEKCVTPALLDSVIGEVLDADEKAVKAGILAEDVPIPAYPKDQEPSFFRPMVSMFMASEAAQMAVQNTVNAVDIMGSRVMGGIAVKLVWIGWKLAVAYLQNCELNKLTEGELMNANLSVDMQGYITQGELDDGCTFHNSFYCEKCGRRVRFYQQGEWRIELHSCHKEEG